MTQMWRQYEPKHKINNAYSHEDGGKMSGTAKANYYYYSTLSITLQHWYHTLIVSF